MTEVVAALIWKGNQFMICQRPAHKARGFLWEFVGGKVESGETKEQAHVQECREELDVTVQVGKVFVEVIHEYPDLAGHPGRDSHTLYSPKLMPDSSLAPASSLGA